MNAEKPTMPKNTVRDESKDEFMKDKCPYCGKSVMVRLNTPFFDDPRICWECQGNMNRHIK